MKIKKIISGIIAAALAVSAISIPVYAEESIDTAQTETTMPANTDPTIDTAALIEEALQNIDGEIASYWKNAYSYLLEDDYTFSDAYLIYDFNTMELKPSYAIYAKKDGVYTKKLSVGKHDNGKYGFSAYQIDSYTKDLLEDEKIFWYGFSMDVLPYEMVYTVEDGFYSLNFKKPMDYTWGNVPYSPFNSGVMVEDDIPVTTEPVVTTEPNVEKVNDSYYGDINLDGKIDLLDAVLSSQAVSGAVQLNEQQILTADCDANGVIDANDTIVLLQFLVHKLDTLPYRY